jgi:hypothetical protein
MRYKAAELKQWWAAICPACNWQGLTRDAAGGGQIADTGDFADPICPECIKTGGYVVLDEDDTTDESEGKQS